MTTESWKQRTTYNFPCPIRFGAGVIDELADHLIENALKAPLLVTDRGLKDLDIFKNIVTSLERKGITPHIFFDIDKNPVKRNVLAGVDSYHEKKCDSIIGIGGGASMDVARAIVLKAHHERDLFDFDDALGGDKYVTEKIPYFITVPTTSGTGSEVGRSTVISEDESHRKRILYSPRLLCKIVFADPELTMGLPPFITAATGVDALTHNIEAYFSKGFHPMCDGIAIEGIRLCFESLKGACLNPNIENRSKMLMAATMGATAFQKGLGIVHSLAHPLSTNFDTHHGLANAIMLPFGIMYNSKECKDKIEHLCAVLGIEVSVASFLKHLDTLLSEIGIPKSLKDLEIKEKDIEALSELAFLDVCHSCNPVVVTKSDFKDIYLKAIK